MHTTYKKNSCCQRKQINKQVNKDSATFVPAAHIKSDHCVQKTKQMNFKIVIVVV